MSIKKVLLIFLVSGFVLAGCGPNPDQETQLSLNNTNGETSNEISDQQAKNQQILLNAKKEKPMRTIQEMEKIKATEATLKTTKGDITIKLFREKAPLTTTNFLNLAKYNFYDGIVFHRVVPGFVVQVGDPTTKDPNSPLPPGSGGPGYTIKDEFNPDLKHDKAGIVSMANAGPDTGGSQFFITLDATPHLDNVHSVFGEVIKGMDVVNSIEVGDKIKTITYQ